MFADDIMLYKSLPPVIFWPSKETYIQSMEEQWTSILPKLSLCSSPVHRLHFLKFGHLLHTSMVCLLKECITLISLVFCSLMTSFLWSEDVESVCCRARRLTFSPYCSQATIIHLYKSKMIPIIEYGCVVWDPYLKRDQILLEYFSNKVTTKKWDTSPSITANLNVPPLSNC